MAVPTGRPLVLQGQREDPGEPSVKVDGAETIFLLTSTGTSSIRSMSGRAACPRRPALAPFTASHL